MSMLALEDKRHYVYAHLYPSGTIFYIGKGVNNRAAIMHKRNPWHKRVVSKHGLEWIILKENLTKTEAYLEERLYIKKAKLQGIQLVNMSEGGEGNKGYRHTKKAKRAIKEGNTGKVVTTATRKLLSAANKGQIVSESQRKQISATLSGRKQPHVSESNRRRKGIKRDPEVQERITKGLRNYYLNRSGVL